MASHCPAARALLVALALVAVAAQPSGPPGAPPGGACIDLPMATGAESRMETAERLLAGRQWQRACPLLQAMIDEAAGLVWDGRAYVPVRAFATRRIAALPAEARQAYAALYEAAARRLLEEGLAQRSERTLQEAAGRYVNTESGLRALSALAALRMDEGEFAAALLTLRSAGPLTSQSPAARAIAVRELLCLARLGRRRDAEELARRLRERGIETVEVAGVERAPEDLVAEALARQGSESGAEGDGAVEAPAAEFAPDGLFPLWTDLAWPGRVEPDWPSIPATQPVASGGAVHVNRDGAVMAVDLHTGLPRWVAAPLGGPWELAFAVASEGRLDQDVLPLYLPVENVHHWRTFDNHGMSTLCCARGRLYAVQMDPLRQEFSEKPWTATQDDLLLANELRCYAADDGTLLWSTAGSGRGAEALRDRWFVTAPTVEAGRAHVLSVRRGEVRAVCLDAVSGRLLWDVPIGPISGSQETQRYSMEFFLADCGPPAVVDGVAVYPTGRGLIAAFDACDGRLLWVSAYPRADVGIERLGLHLNVPNGPWTPGRPVISDGLCLVAPPDGRHASALSLETGATAWQVEFPDGVALLGARAGRLYVQHDGVTCIDVASGGVLWEAPADAASTGVGALGKDVVYVPQVAGLQRVDAATGRALPMLTWPPGTGGGGNLLLLPEALAMCSPERIVVFRRADEALRAADARVTATGELAEPLLVRGTLRALSGDATAVADLEGAVRSAHAGGRPAAAVVRQAARAMLALAARSRDLDLIERAAALAPEDDGVQAEAAVARLGLALEGAEAADALTVYLALCREVGMVPHGGRWGSASLWTHLSELVRVRGAERPRWRDEWQRACLGAIERARRDGDEQALVEMAHWAPSERTQAAALLHLGEQLEERGLAAGARRTYAELLVRRADAEQTDAARAGLERTFAADGDGAAALLTGRAAAPALEHVPGPEPAWSVPGVPVLPERGAPARLPGKVLVLQKTGLTCIDAATGQPAWSIPLAGGGGPEEAAPNPSALPSRQIGWGFPAFLLGPERVAVALPGLMLAVDAADGRVAWTRDIASVRRSSTTRPPRRLQLIRWALRGRPVPPGSGFIPPAAEQPGAWGPLLACRIERPGTANAIDPLDGELLFRYGTVPRAESLRARRALPGGVRGALLAVAGSRLCIAEGEPASLSVLDGRGGRVLARWQVPASPGKRSLTATPAGNVVLADAAGVFLFDLARMRPAGWWRVPGGVGEVLHADDEWILLRTSGGGAAAVQVGGDPAPDLTEAGAGRTVWAARQGETAWFLEASDVLRTFRYGPDRHFLGSDFALRGVRLPDGAPLWHVRLQAAPGAVVSEPVRCGSLWLLTIAEEGRTSVVGLDAATGRRVFAVQLEGEGGERPVPLLVEADRLVLGLGDRTVALEPSGTPVAPPPALQGPP